MRRRLAELRMLHEQICRLRHLARIHGPTQNLKSPGPPSLWFERPVLPSLMRRVPDHA